ncbi:MAG: hypothetical protein C4297_08400 [Gemmataceae bacterium]
MDRRSILFFFSATTAVAAFPLVLSGGTVTTLRVGMADPEWPSAPWHLLIQWSESAARGLGYLIEHGHRLLGWTVGVLALVQTAMAWGVLRGCRRALVVLTLLGVGLQGLLGGLRVLYHAPYGLELAAVHGAMGHVVFALLCLVASMFAPTKDTESVVYSPRADKLNRLAGLVLLLCLLQLIPGVILRQFGQGPIGAVLVAHIFLALAIAFHVLLLYVRLQNDDLLVHRALKMPARALIVLVCVQWLIGPAAWAAGSGQGASSGQVVHATMALTATVHAGLAALVLAAAAVLYWRCREYLQPIAVAEQEYQKGV